ncbi:MAG: sporulation protein [Clostridiales bacterium]|nr:sporulation protein [Clostridiales bacterium]
MIRIYSLLHSLGITANYAGFFYTSKAVSLAMEDMEYLLLVTKRLYPDMAAHFCTTANSIERGIRTVIDVAWKNSSPLLCQMARKPLYKKPSASEFIAVLTLSMLYMEHETVENLEETLQQN